MVNCYVCNRPFEPDPARFEAWAKSGRSFDPTDWECPDCRGCEVECAEAEMKDDLRSQEEV